jgi:hypothetical protein
MGVKFVKLKSYSFHPAMKSLSLNKPLRLNPPLKKGDIGGFALESFG